MTLRELSLYFEGYTRRLETHRDLMAWHAANVMNVWVKKRITADMLTGKEKKKNDQLVELQYKAKRGSKDKTAEIKIRDDDHEVNTDFLDDEPSRWAMSLVADSLVGEED